MPKLTWIATLLIFGGLMLQPAAAQDSDATTTETTEDDSSDPVVEALERQKKIAELKKDIAKAEKDELEAKLPDTETTGSDGSVTLNEGAGYFAELLAYHALTEAADEVAAQVKAPATSGQEVIVSSDLDLASRAQLWESMKLRLDDFEKVMDDLIQGYPTTLTVKESFTAALATVTAVLGAAADVVAFFRSSTEITSREFTLSNRAMVALVARSLSNLEGNEWKVIEPTLGLAKTQLMTELEQALAKRTELVAHRRALEIAVQPSLAKLAELRLERELAEAKLAKLKAAKPLDPKAIEELDEKIAEIRQEGLEHGNKEGTWKSASARIDLVLTAFDATVKAMTEGAEGKPSPLEAVAVVDALKSRPGAKVLYLEVSSQGGEVHVTKSVWRTRLTYVAGTVVTFYLADQSGSVESSGAVVRPAARSVKASNAPKLALP